MTDQDIDTLIRLRNRDADWVRAWFAAPPPPPTITSPYLTANEAAVYLRTTTQGVYSLVKRRQIKPLPGRRGRLLFTRYDLDKYLTR